MKEQFEEITSMLDKVIGGQDLFAIDTQVSDVERCSTICSNECTPSFGTVNGSKRGSITPSLPIEKAPFI